MSGKDAPAGGQPRDCGVCGPQAGTLLSKKFDESKKKTMMRGLTRPWPKGPAN